MDKNNIIVKLLIGICLFFLGCAAMFLFIGHAPKLFSTTKLEKDVTVTDKGIADAVEKVYDSVVVVATYKDNKLTSTGTGFVYKKDKDTAYILTNNHVIDGGTKITVRFTTDKVVETTVVGSDVISDIAVLSVKSSDILGVAPISSEKELRIGDTVFTVGAPVNSVYSWTVTRGIISGKDRMVEVELPSNSGDYVMRVLQTDAAINSGNSGGPLCNSNGEVIGITSLKLVDASVEGMGFAIPIETATEYAEKLVAGEKITRPYIGVSMYNVSDALYRTSYGVMLSKYDITSGVLITSVEKNSAADKAGLKDGDVIIKVADKEVNSIGFFRYYLYNYEVGDKVNITIIRNGEEKTLSITLATKDKTY